MVYTRRLTAVLLVSLSSFASNPKQSKGPVEITVHAPVDVVKANIVRYMTSIGYRIESDSQFQLAFWQEMKGGAGFATQLMLGNAYSEKPKYEVSFQLSPVGDEVTVDAVAEFTIKQAFGNVKRGDLTQGKSRPQLVSMLDNVKAQSEVQAAPAPASNPTLKTREDSGVVRSKTPVVIAVEPKKIFDALKKHGEEKGWIVALEGADYIILSHGRVVDQGQTGIYHIRFEIKSENGASALSYVLSASDQGGKLIDLTDTEKLAFSDNVDKALASIKSALELEVKQASF